MHLRITNMQAEAHDAFEHIFDPQVRLRSSTNTQSLPHYRLSIMPSQTQAGSPLAHCTLRREITHEATPRSIWQPFIGLDWADAKHDIYLQAAGSERREFLVLEHSLKAIDAWGQTLRTRSTDNPLLCVLS